MYKVGDIVKYGVNGICKINNIAKMEFCGEKKDYYELRLITKSDTVFFVPADNEQLIGRITPVLSKKEILALIKNIDEEPIKWIDNDKKRAETYSNILTSDDRKSIMGVGAAIFKRKTELEEKGKKIHLVDEKLFKDAQKLISEEFSYVLGIPSYEVQDFIMEHIHK